MPVDLTSGRRALRHDRDRQDLLLTTVDSCRPGCEVHSDSQVRRTATVWLEIVRVYVFGVVCDARRDNLTQTLTDVLQAPEMDKSYIARG